MRLWMEQLYEDDKSLWNKWVVSHPDAHFYHLWEWGNILSATYNYQRFYFVAKCDEDIVGVLPLVHIQSRIFGNKLVSLPFCEYGGPLLSNSLGSSIVEAVNTLFSKVASELIKRLKVDYIEIRQPSPSLPLSVLGFHPFGRYLTFRVDLTQGEAGVWRNLDKKCRNAIRKAAKAGIKTIAVDEGLVKHYYDLHLNTQKRHGSPPHCEAFFTNMFNALNAKGLTQMVLAVYDGRVIGGIIVFCLNGKMYWWGNVLDRKYASLNPTNSLLWHVIQWGMRNNFEIFELGRTRLETKGIYRFKEGWGGQRVLLKDYVLATRVMKLPDPVQMKYAILSKVWSRLPLVLARQLGPGIVSQIGL